jgi:superfamily II DNA helicase RecQ
LNTQTKLDGALQFLLKDECRSVQLLRYFGQESEACGKCDICKKKQFETSVISNNRRAQLLEFLSSPKTLSDLMQHTGLQEEKLRQLLRELTLEELISESNGVFSRK